MSESHDPEVVTALKFLTAVVGKGHTDTTLRKYLQNSRNLTDDQIDMAFKIFYCRRDRQTEQPGVKIAVGTLLTQAKYPFLLPEKVDKGEILIKSFLKAEYNYCNILQCLIGEYYPRLCEMTDEKKIDIPRKELEPIF